MKVSGIVSIQVPYVHFRRRFVCEMKALRWSQSPAVSSLCSDVWVESLLFPPLPPPSLTSTLAGLVLGELCHLMQDLVLVESQGSQFKF